VLAVVLSTQSCVRLQGYLDYLELERMKAGWHDQSGMPHDRELSQSFKLGYRASEYERENTEYRFMLASLHAWREKGLRLWPKQSKAETDKVIENLKAALARRPSWFEAWMLLALVKYQSNELDNEFTVALEKSIETGKYETTVHHGLSIIGPGVFHRLGPALQRSVIETLDIGLDNSHVNEFVVERIVMSGLLERFRSRLESDKELNRLLNKYLKKRKELL
jgi:hypothetical protein